MLANTQQEPKELCKWSLVSHTFELSHSHLCHVLLNRHIIILFWCTDVIPMRCPATPLQSEVNQKRNHLSAKTPKVWWKEKHMEVEVTLNHPVTLESVCWCTCTTHFAFWWHFRMNLKCTTTMKGKLYFDFKKPCSKMKMKDYSFKFFFLTLSAWHMQSWVGPPTCSRL